MKFELTTAPVALFNVKKAKKLFDTEIKKTVDKMMGKTVANLMFTAPKGGTGALRNSIQSDRKGLDGRVWVGVNYGSVIEKGRRPSYVPSSALPGLVRWLRSSTKGRAYFASLRSKYKNITITSAAHALNAKLGKYGFKANPFFSRGIKRTKKVYVRESKFLLGIIARGLAK